MKTKVRDLLEQLQRFDPDKELEFHGSIRFASHCKRCGEANMVKLSASDFDRVVEESGTVVVKL